MRKNQLTDSELIHKILSRKYSSKKVLRIEDYIGNEATFDRVIIDDGPWLMDSGYVLSPLIKQEGQAAIRHIDDIMFALPKDIAVRLEQMLEKESPLMAKLTCTLSEPRHGTKAVITANVSCIKIYTLDKKCIDL